jgi:hypothetical protein
MKRTERYELLVACLLAVGLAALGAWMWHRAANLREQINRTASSCGRLEAEIAATQAAKRVTAAAVGTAGTQRPATSGNDEVESSDGSEDRFERLQTLVRRAETEEIYGALFAKLGLSREEEEEFLELMSQRGAEMVRLSRALRAQSSGAAGGRQAAEEALRQAAERHAAALRSVLGDAGFDAFTEAKRQAPARQLTNSLAAAAFQGGSPLSRKQGDQLIELIATKSPAKADYVGTSQTDWDAVYAAAGGFLSSA